MKHQNNQTNQYQYILIIRKPYLTKVHVYNTLFIKLKQGCQINTRKQSLGWIRHQLWIPNMLIPQVIKVNVYQTIIYQIKIKMLNKYEEAITWLDKALAINPQHVNSLSDKGQCLLKIIYQIKIRLLNKYEDAITWLDKALAMNPQHVLSLSDKGQCLLNNYLLNQNKDVKQI